MGRRCSLAHLVGVALQRTSCSGSPKTTRKSRTLTQCSAPFSSLSPCSPRFSLSLSPFVFYLSFSLFLHISPYFIYFSFYTTLSFFILTCLRSYPRLPTTTYHYLRLPTLSFLSPPLRFVRNFHYKWVSQSRFLVSIFITCVILNNVFWQKDLKRRHTATAPQTCPQAGRLLKHRMC